MLKIMKSYKIYILLTHTGTLFSKAIRACTKREYSHVSIGLDKDLNELYSFGRKKPYNPIMAGFVQEKLSDGVYQIYENTACRVYELEISEEEYQSLRENIQEFIENKEDYKYHLVGLFGVLLNTPIERENAYFCSYFVAYILEKSGIRLFDKHASLATPNDFMECNRLHMVYEGKLSNYHSFPAYSNAISTNL